MSASDLSFKELPTTEVARSLVRSLTRGTAIPEGVRFIHVGHANWLAAQVELLDELAVDSSSDTKFVRGSYGAGKSHFLSVVQDVARKRHWITSHVECKVDGVQIDRFETLYPKIALKMRSIDWNLSEEIDPAHRLLDKWVAQVFQTLGFRGSARPYDAEVKIFDQLVSMIGRSNLPTETIRALTAYTRASWVNDAESTSKIAGWLRGTNESIRVPDYYLQRPQLNSVRRFTSYTQLRPIGKGTSREALRGLLWLIRSVGYSGLLLCIDEIEELSKLGTQKRRDQALQALRDFVDSAGGELGFKHLCMYLAATPDMFESPDYFPRYDALSTRIQPVSDQINWRAPIVDLDRTPLSVKELERLAARIAGIHSVAYDSDPNTIKTDLLDGLVAEVTKNRMRVAKPRLLTRVLIDELERTRQRGWTFRSSDEIAKSVHSVAERLVKESEK